MKAGAPKGNRTPVFAVKGRRPGPLDDGRGLAATQGRRARGHIEGSAALASRRDGSRAAQAGCATSRIRRPRPSRCRPSGRAPASGDVHGLAAAAASSAAEGLAGGAEGDAAEDARRRRPAAARAHARRRRPRGASSRRWCGEGEDRLRTARRRTALPARARRRGRGWRRRRSARRRRPSFGPSALASPTERRARSEEGVEGREPAGATVSARRHRMAAALQREAGLDGGPHGAAEIDAPGMERPEPVPRSRRH